MRLSDVKGERTFEVLAAIVEPVSNIVGDEAVKKAFKSRKRAKGQTDAQLFAERLKAVLPRLLSEHRDDVVAVLAAIAGTTPEEYMAGCSLSSLMQDVFELLTDEEFVTFLP